MQKYNVKELIAKEVIPGFNGKFVHAETMSVAYWDIEGGSTLNEHTHKNEQIMNLIEGEFEMEIDGEILKLYAGAVVIIPSNARHSGRAITHCRIIDIYHPVRGDLKS